MSNGKGWANLAAANLRQRSSDHIIQRKKASLCALKHGQDKDTNVLLSAGTEHEPLLHFMASLRSDEGASSGQKGDPMAFEVRAVLTAHISN
jgi:hypothetical protein